MAIRRRAPAVIASTALWRCRRTVFWIAPIAGALLGAAVYRAIGGTDR
ncbi:MAG: hypothetical protein JSR59_07100 [Proteobacteria bacterium]|nr:hypothetical protein [Pseudomonadota bacterium]